MKRTGCPCGCLNGVDCVTEQPAPPARTCWRCAGLSGDVLARGVGCSPAHSTPAGVDYMLGGAA